jgi:methylated-DNA-[protein]-cysteine S-methyltransferase
MLVATAFFDGPLGWIRLQCAAEALVSVDFIATPPARYSRDESACLDQACAWLAAYFKGTPLPPMPPLAPGGTSFQRSVWSALSPVTEGQRVTYGTLAKQLDTAPRAVGGALRANPIPLFIPCHRVVSASGPGGYGGSSVDGLSRKRWLLGHERGLKSGRVSPVC